MTQDRDTTADHARLAAVRRADPDPLTTAQQIVDLALAYMPEADEVSLTVRVKQRPSTLASTGAMASASDEIQYEIDEGPCIHVAAQESWVRSGEVARDARWPRWGPRAAELGVGSLLAVQLLDLKGSIGALNIYSRQTGSIGALNIYSRQTGAFGDHDAVDRATVFAVHAAHALSTASLVRNLHTALSSRHDIGMAQGIMMERYGLDANRSFELLRRLSTDRNVKLREVAAEIARTGQLPDYGGAAPANGTASPKIPG